MPSGTVSQFVYASAVLLAGAGLWLGHSQRRGVDALFVEDVGGVVVGAK